MNTPFNCIAAERSTRSILTMMLSMVLLAFTFALGSPTATAKECENGNCKGIKIYNYTDYSYKIQFKLCCDGEIKITDCWEVPKEGVKFDFDGCTLGNWRFCDTLPEKVCYVWYPDECVIKIYYCE